MGTEPRLWRLKVAIGDKAVALCGAKVTTGTVCLALRVAMGAVP